MLVYLEEWHLGDGLPAPSVGAVSNLAVVAEHTTWFSAGSSPPGPPDRTADSTDPGTRPDVVGTVVWRTEDQPHPARELTGPVELGFVVRAADGLVLARSGRSRLGDTAFGAQRSRSIPPAPPVASSVVLPAAELTVDPGYLWDDLRDLDGAPEGWIDYRVDRIRPCGPEGDDGRRVVFADEPVAVSDPGGRVSGFLLDLTAVTPSGNR